MNEQVSKNYLPTRKKNRSMFVSFRQRYPIISEQVAPSLEFEGQFERGIQSLKQHQDVLVVTLISQIIYPRQRYPRQPFRGHYDLWTRWRPLKLPILNDRVRRQPSGVYPKSAHVRVCRFQLILSLYMLMLSILILG